MILSYSQVYYRRHRRECIARRVAWNRLHKDICNARKRSLRKERKLWNALDELASLYQLKPLGGCPLPEEGAHGPEVER